MRADFYPEGGVRLAGISAAPADPASAERGIEN